MKINGVFSFLLFFITVIIICFVGISTVNAQYNCTWALNATTLKTPNLTGVQAPNVLAGNMILVSVFLHPAHIIQMDTLVQ